MKRSTVLHIGFDDTDSRKGMCTTYLAYKIVEYLKKEQVKFLDYPYLIRFNPNVPWKTRGNGAVAIKIETSKPEIVKKNIVQFVKKYSAIRDGANPGLVFYKNEEIPKSFSEFGKMALYKLVSRSYAKQFAMENGLEMFSLGNGQGLIGAIGAIGYNFRDHTFELISYRNKINFGRKREIVKESVKKMQKMTFPRTFNSFDDAKNRILIAPHGQDPVFFGVRGEDVNSVIKGASLVRSDEKIEGYMIFRSNQGTGDHLEHELDIADLKPFSSGYIVGRISSKPRIEKGGHVFFSITKGNKTIKCATYKQTGLGTVVSGLIKGDLIKIGGGIRKASKNHERVLNVEFLKVLKLEKDILWINPLCHRCNKSMKSKGKNQGFRCVRCGNMAAEKIRKENPRKIQKQFYLPVSTAHRHLTRPLQRIKKFNTKLQFDKSSNWFRHELS